MKIKDGYHKTTICGVCYLLPFGQEITAYAPNLKLNATGEILWDALVSGVSPETLPDLLMEKFEHASLDTSQLRRDVEQFLQLLKFHGVILPADKEVLPEDKEVLPEDASVHTIKIASLIFSLHGPMSLYNTYFSDFSTDEASCNGRIFCIAKEPPHMSCGRILIRNKELTIAEDDENYLFYFIEDYGIHEMRVSKDGKQTYLFYDSEASTDENLFQALRFAFLILAQQHEIYALHSASLLYRDKAWLFSAPSGTGKSTHTALWQNQFQTPVLNGDLNLLGFQNGVPTVFGLPWCGTSGLHSTASYPLGGVIFLAQSLTNQVLTLSPDKQALNLTQRMISPTWTGHLLQQNLDFAQRLTPRIFTARLLCNPEPEAAVLMKEAIDRA